MTVTVTVTATVTVTTTVNSDNDSSSVSNIDIDRLIAIFNSNSDSERTYVPCNSVDIVCETWPRSARFDQCVGKVGMGATRRSLDWP